MEGIRASFEPHASPYSPTGEHEHPRSPREPVAPVSAGGPPPPMYAAFVNSPAPQLLTPYAAAEAMVESGYNRHRARYDTIIIKGFFAGLFIAFGTLSQAAIGGNSTQFLTLAVCLGPCFTCIHEADNEQPGIARFYESLVFPIGYALLYLLSLELLTWNMVTYALATIRLDIPAWAWPLNFFVLFWANLVGALTFVGIFAKFGAMSSTAEMTSWFVNRANFLSHWGWHNIFLRTIAGEWLVALALFFAAQSSSLLSKLAGIWITVGALAILQLPALVSDFVFYPYAMLLGADLNTAYYIGHVLIPELIGVLIGGGILVLAVWWSYLSQHEPNAILPYENGNNNHHHRGGTGPMAGQQERGETAQVGERSGRTVFPRLSTKKAHRHEQPSSAPQNATSPAQGGEGEAIQVV